MRYELYIHGLVSHQERLEHERYVMRNETGDIVGVKLACPSCKSNKFVRRVYIFFKFRRMDQG